MRLLITGGAGFIGSNFIHYWLHKYPKDKIKVLDSLTYAGNFENLRPVERKIEFIKGDITNRIKVKEALKNIDVVVHFAAESHVDRSVFDPAGFWRTNVEGTRVILEESVKMKVARFHHISTDEVYGELPMDSNEKFNESTPYAPRPENLYAVSKAEADRLVREFYKKTGMFITISNCSNNYGPFQFPEKFVPLIITNLIDGIKVPLHGDGHNVRDWIHTNDHSVAVDLILRKGKPGETYLVGASNDRPNRYVAEHVVKLYGRDLSWIKYAPDRHSNDRRYAIDASKIVNELGWKPEIPGENFDEGLASTIDWYKKHEDWWRPLLQRRALISDGEKKIFAFISLDREVGKIKLSFNTPESVQNKIYKDDLNQKILIEGTERRFNLIKDKLKTRKWFLDSSKLVRKQLLELAKNPRSSGFVEDMANRPVMVGDLKQIKVLKIEYAPKKFPIYGVVAWFEVEDLLGNRHSEALYSWGVGPKSGVKFLVFIKINKKIAHLVLLKDNRFPAGGWTYSLAGGFPKFNESVFELILRKLKDELGIEINNGSMEIGEVINLGRIHPDAGMTNNHPLIYAVILEVADKTFPPLVVGETYDQEKGAIIWPIERLSELVNKVDDAYFLSALTRLTLSGVTDLNIKF